jgi:hypothetical protein
MIERSQFPDTIAILANRTYRFEISNGAQGSDLAIVGRFNLPNNVQFLPTACGLLAFDFRGSDLGGFIRLESHGVGQTPTEVMSNRDDLIALQAKRIRFAVFVAACVYGTHISINHTSLREPNYPGLADIYCWFERDQLLCLSPQDYELLQHRLPNVAESRRFPESTRTIVRPTLDKGVRLAERLLRQAGSYRIADPQSMIVMAYQAMRLHGLQHAGASIALAATVIEVALQEIVARTVPADNVKKMKLAALTNQLTTTGNVDSYLAARIERLRTARNTLMHQNEDGTSRQSGEALTIIRDVLKLCTGEDEFDLNTGWSYKL